MPNKTIKQVRPQTAKSQNLTQGQRPTTAKNQNIDPNNKLTKSPTYAKVPLNPYSAQTLYTLKQGREHQTNGAVLLSDGMTFTQWNQINEFQIIGQRQKKKANYNIALDHFFNLRSMYKKINNIRYKNAVKSSIPVPVKTKDMIRKNSQPLPQEPREVHQVPRKKIKRKTSPVHIHVENHAKNDQEKKKIKAKKKVKPAKKQQVVDDIEEFRNTNEQDLIASTVNVNGLAKRDVDLDEMLLQKSSKKIEEKRIKTREDMSPYSSDKKGILESKVVRQGREVSSPFPIEIEDSVRKITSVAKEEQTEFNVDGLSEKLQNEGEEDDCEVDEIMESIPELVDENDEDRVTEFKEQIIEMIMNYEIYEEEEFINFFEAVCMKNSGVDREFMAGLFEDVKETLYKKYQEGEEE